MSSEDEFLLATELIDVEHPDIAKLAAELTLGLSTDRDRALAIFRFVSCEIQFGFGRGFWDQKASDVLHLGRGYCNTKSTLFTALLRAARIPARQVFVEIDARILDGIIDPGGQFVDHSYVEVWLDGRWIATDAYIADPPLFWRAQSRLRQSGALLGYGVHAAGTCEWDGVASSFCQFNIQDPPAIGRTHWGVFKDNRDFYARVGNTNNRLNPLLRLAFGFLSRHANTRAQAVRDALEPGL